MSEWARRTLARSTGVITGRGLFTGVPARLRFEPAPAGGGLKIRRGDIGHAPLIDCHVRHEFNPPRLPGRCTSLALEPGLAPSASNPSAITVEHALSALAGLRVTDALLVLEGPEVPILDGSSAEFVAAIQSAGIVDADGTAVAVAPASVMRVGDDRAWIEANPGAGLMVEYELAYAPDSGVPASRVRLVVTPDVYEREIAPARTFCTLEEAQALRAAGLFTQFTPRDLLVIGPKGEPIDNTFRFSDEPARHKILDLIGDLALCGRPFEGEYAAVRSGHGLNRALARRLSAIDAP